MATGLRLSLVRWGEGVADEARAVDVHRVWPPGLADGGHDLPGHPDLVGAVVRRDLVGDEPEERRERARVAAHPRIGKLPHGLDLAPQAPPRDGPTRPRPSLGRGGGRRDVRRRPATRW